MYLQNPGNTNKSIQNISLKSERQPLYSYHKNTNSMLTFLFFTAMIILVVMGIYKIPVIWRISAYKNHFWQFAIGQALIGFAVASMTHILLLLLIIGGFFLLRINDRNHGIMVAHTDVLTMLSSRVLCMQCGFLISAILQNMF